MRILTKLVCFAVISVLLTTTALSWGDVTHMYLVKHLFKKPGLLYLNHMYGSILPDAFNFMLDANGQYLYYQTHQNFEPFYTAASRYNQIETAFGFVSHNQLFGADWTAHVDAFTMEEGYAVEKGIGLAPSLVPSIITILTDAGLDPYTSEAVAYGIAPELGHGLAETAVDILVKRDLDAMIGLHMYYAAKKRQENIPMLLSTVYAPGLSEFAGISLNDAKALIVGSENQYRQYILQYGQLFMLPESDMIAMLSVQTAAIAKMYLEAATGHAVTVTVTPEQIAYFLASAIDIVQPDYAEELSRTLAHLGEGMLPYRNRLFVCVRWGTAPQPGLIESAPSEFSLSQNFPNPFNPATSVSYALPVAAYVSLKIYNMLGQEVAVLVDGETPAGEHTATWNASGLPSGTYICRIRAGEFTAIKQMMLLK